MEEFAHFICSPRDDSGPKWEEIEANLKSINDDAKKLAALKLLIQYQSSGESPPDSILMTVLQYVSKSQDHKIKRLLFLYYEIVDTRDQKGNLKNEFLLICNGLIEDLTHTNEYIRAAALRFASKFQERELISPCVSAIEQSLNHLDSYVRRHAVVAIGRIHQRWPDLAPDAPSDIAELLRKEQSASCKRVAFLVLCDISQDLAAEFLAEIVDDSLLHYSQPMQLTATALIKQLCTDKRKASYLPPLLELLESPSSAVQLEAALTLLNIASSPIASKAGMSTLCHIMNTVPNSSLQLSIADQIERLIPTHSTIVQSLAIEILSVLKAKPARPKILHIVEKLANESNVKDIVSNLLGNLQKASSLRSKENEKPDATQFMRMLLTSLRVITASQPKIIDIVYDGVRSFITDLDPLISYDALTIVRDAAISAPNLREKISLHLENLLESIHTSRVLRSVVYILSLFTQNPETVDIITDAFTSTEEGDTSIDTATVVLEDGTYVQRTTTAEYAEGPTPFQLLSQDKLLASAISVALARICCRLPNCNIAKATHFIKYIVSTLNLESELSRISFALNALNHISAQNIIDVLVNAPLESLESYIKYERNDIALVPTLSAPVSSTIEVDNPLNFSSLLGRRFESQASEIKRIENKKGVLVQMTGTSDAIFTECRMISNKFDIALEFRLLNQTSVDLFNIRVELNCVGKLELIDRPAAINLLSGQSQNIKFTIKVTSAEAGRIFGTVIYEVVSNPELKFLPIAVITVPCSDYLDPSAQIDIVNFRKKWDDFEWEKKLTINCAFKSLTAFLNRVCEVSKLRLVTEIDDNLPFLTANLYSVSYFGEEVLANVNCEYDDGHVKGFLRLRTDTQNMALSFSSLVQTIE